MAVASLARRAYYAYSASPGETPQTGGITQPKERTEMPTAKARHILVNTKEEADNLKTQIEGGADFAKLAKKHSTCPSGKDGGSLGEFGPGQMVKEFDEVVFSADIGSTQGPVKTQFGYHLLEVTERTD